MKLTLAHRVRPSDDVLFQEVGDESVLLNLASESYFGLDSVGTRAWSSMGDASSLQHAFDMLLSEYAVEPDQLESDLLSLFEKLIDAGLVQVD